MILDESNEILVAFKFKHLFVPLSKTSTKASSMITDWLTFICVTFIIMLCFILSKTNLAKWYFILIVAILCIMIVISMILICCQPQGANITTFKVNNFSDTKLKRINIKNN